MLPAGSAASNRKDSSRRKRETGHLGTRAAPFVGVDAEATGVDAARDRIVEIAVITLDEELEPVEELVARVNPGIPIPEAASRIHGITDQEVAACPGFEHVAAKARRMIGDRIIIAHNASFDIGLLNMEFERAGVAALPINAPAIDTLQIETAVNARTLEACFFRYTGKPHEGAHAARNDVLAAVKVLQAQRRQHAHLLPTTLRALVRGRLASQLGQEVRWILDPNRRFYRDANGGVRFNFGRHRHDLVSRHPGYVDWMVREGFHEREIAIARRALPDVTDARPRAPRTVDQGAGQVTC